MLARPALVALRIAVPLNLILGLLFWTGNAADSLVPLHVGLGIVAVLSLWTLAVAQAMTNGGNWGLAVGAVVLGIILAASGGAQDQILAGSSHWIIQVIHLLLGLSALGFGERLGGIYRSSKVAAMA
jgi:hypothetical protein